MSSHMMVTVCRGVKTPLPDWRLPAVERIIRDLVVDAFGSESDFEDWNMFFEDLEMFFEDLESHGVDLDNRLEAGRWLVARSLYESAVKIFFNLGGAGADDPFWPQHDYTWILIEDKTYFASGGMSYGDVPTDCFDDLNKLRYFELDKMLCIFEPKELEAFEVVDDSTFKKAVDLVHWLREAPYDSEEGRVLDALATKISEYEQRFSEYEQRKE